MSAAIILAGLFSWYLRWVEIKPSGEIDFGVIPLSDGDWSGQVKELSKEETEILRANRTFSATYRTPTSTEVDVFIAYFTSQKYGSSIHSPRNCLPGSGWIIGSIKKTPWTLESRSFIINKMIIWREGRRFMVYYWYLTRNGEIDSELGLKFDLIKNSLLGKATDGALIRITAPLGAGLSDNPDIQWFVKKFIKYIYSSLPLRA
ncbi:MAG: EpsI family protein [candidate division Zixibacteria bacterium]|nr:EpsI family protein [candidate division Zixibacteria bacterium]